MDDCTDVATTRLRMAGSSVAFLAPLVVYLLTLAREITFVDSGELAAVAATLGIAHPPGYPLFTLLGRLLAMLPIGTVAFRVGLLSAFTTSLAALLLYRLAVMITGCILPRAGAAARELAPLAGALLFAFALTPWSQAAVVEIYGLQVCLVMAFLTASGAALRRPREAVQYWPWVALTAAGALTNHLSGVLLLPGALAFIVLSLVARGRGSDRTPVPLVRSVGAVVAPLLLYLYLPIRAAMNPAVAWDYPTTLHRFVVHVSARQYQGLLGSQGLRMSELERFLGQQLPQEAGWALPLLSALGFAALLWRGRRFLIVTLLPLIAYLLYNAAYPIPDIDLYYIPVIAILALWAAVGTAVLAHGVAWAVQAIASPTRRAPAGVPVAAAAAPAHALRPGRAAVGAAAAVSALACLLCVQPLRGHWHANDQHRFDLLARYTRDTFKYLEPNAMLFTSRWDALSSPALYYQNVMGLRPDVFLLDVRLLANPTLQWRLAARVPDLAQACRGELEAVAEVARSAERGRPYDIADGRFRFARMRRKLVEQSMALRPTYVSGEMMHHPMIEGLGTRAEGLVMRLTADSEFRPFPVPEFEGPGMRGRDARDKAEQEICSEYGVMLRSRARYLAGFGHDMEAEAVASLAGHLSR